MQRLKNKIIELSASAAMNNSFEWKSTKQLSLIGLLASVFIPSFLAFLSFHFVLPILHERDVPTLIGWPLVASIGLLIFSLYAIFRLYFESKELNISLLDRMCIHRISIRIWLICFAILVIGLVAIAGLQELNKFLIQFFNFKIPIYMPFFLDPNIDSRFASMQEISPGYNIQGNSLILLLMAVTLLLNIITEELYFRAWLLPKMERYGKLSWVFNAFLFALYHTFQIWLLPIILAASLVFAYIFYFSKSIWPSLVFHLIMNFLISMIGITSIVFP
jgi:uncharacterized protein